MSALVVNAGADPAAFHADFHADIESCRPQFVMLIYPGMSFLDLAPARRIFRNARGDVHLAWKERKPVLTDRKIRVMPTTTFEDCPYRPDVLFIPGASRRVPSCTRDPEVLEFVAGLGAQAKYVTSICNGSLVLDAAGVGSSRGRGRSWTRYLRLSVFRGA